MIEIKEELRDVKLKGFENYDLAKILYMPSEFDRIYPHKDRSIVSLFFSLLKHSFFQKEHFRYQEIPNSSILFVFIPSDKRKDVTDLFNSVVSLVHTKDTLITSKSSLLKKVNIITGIKLLPYLYYWNKKLKETNLGKYQKLKILLQLVIILKRDFQTSFINISKYKLLVVFFDASPLYNFYVQKFQQAGIETATLQHGVILSRREKFNHNIDFAGIELNNCISNYLLAWNQFTYQEAIKSGIDKKRIQVVGISRCINWPTIKKTAEKKIFGIILDGKFTEETNLSMISCANKLAEYLNCKYIVKYHPAFIGDEYDNVIEKKYFSYICKSDLSIPEYAELVDFSLIANSSAFIELVYIKHKTYRFSDGNAIDKYRDIPSYVFKSFSELIDLYNSKNNPSIDEKLYEILCTVENIKESYQKFFQTFDNG